MLGMRKPNDLSLTLDNVMNNMVDSNLHREKTLPLERAFFYKIKPDAMKR